MRTAKEVYETREHVERSANDGRIDYKDIAIAAMKEYAREVIDDMMANSHELIYIDKGNDWMNDEEEAVFSYEAVDKYKKNLK